MPLVGHKIETTSDNFGGLVRENCLLVDKTLMIKEFIEGKKVSLIVRPRRFGKTLNLSMLQYFLSAEVAGKSTAGLFDNFAIAQEDNGQFLKQHQGQYPVIFITFKDTKESSIESTVSQIRNLIRELYREHEKSLNSDKINISDKVMFQQYLEGSIDNETLQSALKFLSEFLYQAYDKKAIILIDEYDTPLTNAYQKNFLEPLTEFMRDMLSAALKTNLFLEKGLMTGILRVSKNNMLSGLNNLEVYTLLEKPYASYFGFTEKEVLELIDYTKMTEISVEKIRAYYNGYKIGETIIYNPWSTMKFLDRKELLPYWVATSNDKLLQTLFLGSNENTKQQLTCLMQGETITGEINVNLQYEDLVKQNGALWALLLFSGYLTIVSKTLEFSYYHCQLKIPNKEIRAQYQEIFAGKLKENLGGSVQYHSFLKSLLEGKADLFTQFLRTYLFNSLSFRDVVGENKAENFYHGFVAGLVASVQDTHRIDSNKESGLGLYDIILIPKNINQTLGIVLEFKHVRKNLDQKDTMKNAATLALAQINHKAYITELTRHPHIKTALKIGLAFSDKSVISVFQTEDLLTHENTSITWSKTYHMDKSLDYDY